MVSISPNSESYDYSHMYNMGDNRGPAPLLLIDPNSIMGFLTMYNNFSKFAYIVRLARLESLFNDQQADVTLLLPSDSENNISENMLKNMDESTARSIVLFSTINRKINYELLSQSPAKYVFTQNTSNKLYIETFNNTTYLNNRQSQIIKPDILMNNGLIHIISNFLIPDSFINTGSYKQF